MSMLSIGVLQPMRLLGCVAVRYWRLAERLATAGAAVLSRGAACKTAEQIIVPD